MNTVSECHNFLLKALSDKDVIFYSNLINSIMAHNKHTLKDTENVIVEKKVTKSSYQLGKEGEEIIFSLLTSMNYCIEDIRACPGRGDFMIKFPDKSCMIEVKNYKSKAPVTELDKFIQNLSAHPYSFGIFISLYSDVNTFNHKEYNIYKTSDHKPYIILNRFVDDEPIMKIKLSIILNIIQSKCLYESNPIDINLIRVTGESIKHKVSSMSLNMRKLISENDQICTLASSIINEVKD